MPIPPNLVAFPPHNLIQLPVAPSPPIPVSFVIQFSPCSEAPKVWCSLFNIQSLQLAGGHKVPWNKLAFPTNKTPGEHSVYFWWDNWRNVDLSIIQHISQAMNIMFSSVSD